MKNLNVKRLMKYALIFGVVVFVFGLTPAHADTITYDVNGTFTGGASLSGQIVIDTSANSILSGSFTVGGTTYSSLFVTSISPTEYAAVFTTPGDPTGNPMFVIFISIAPDGSLTLCSTANVATCGDTSFLTLDSSVTETTLASGSIVPTPEPASFLLLGSGLLGLALLGRKRLAATTNA